MTTTNRDQQYSIDDIRGAFTAARDGNKTDHEHPLSDLAREMLKTNHVYLIGPNDLDSYLEAKEEDYGELTEKQRQTFRQRARRHINNTESFGEILNICMDLAFDDAITGVE